MGYSRDSLAPSANLSSSVSGSAIWPRFERWTSVVSPAALTESTAWSSRAVVYTQSRQNQSRSLPDTSAMVRKKSAGCGCLKVQRRTYSRSARSNVSLPSTASRNTVSINAGFWYAAQARSRCSTGLSMSGCSAPGTAEIRAAPSSSRRTVSPYAVPTRRVPAEVGRGGPRDVAHLPCDEVPRLGARGGLGAVRRGFRLGHDLYALGGAARPREAGALLGAPHRERVRHRPRPRDEKARGERERDVEVAVFQVKLARPDVGERVPAVHVVVYDQARVPLADLVEARADAPHPPAAVGRDGKVPRDVAVDRAARRQRPRQLDPHHRAVLGALEGPPARGEALDRDAAREPLAREVEHRAAGEVQRRLAERVGDAVRRKQILLDLHPQERERVGRVIDIVDPFAASDRLAGRVEGRADHIIHALLPVIRPRSSGRTAYAPRRRKRERAERRGIGDGPLERQRGDG